MSNTGGRMDGDEDKEGIKKPPWLWSASELCRPPYPQRDKGQEEIYDFPCRL
jgi:hypothetical protein